MHSAIPQTQDYQMHAPIPVRRGGVRQVDSQLERLAEGTSDEDRAANMVLKEELVVALTLGGARTACTER